MKRVSKTALLIGLAFVASTGFAGAALAAPDGNTQATPKNWNYEIKDGKRVPQGQPRGQCGRKLARGSAPGQVHHRQGKDRERRVSRDSPLRLASGRSRLGRLRDRAGR